MAKVLLVEDDNNLREIYQARLMAEGYDIVAAQNGEEALVSAKQNKPDLIISDVMMPRISGFEMLDILRNTDELKNTKIIMLTALGQAEDQARADNLGADKYLVKSQVTLEDIVNAAKELLGPTAVVMPQQPAATATQEQPAVDVPAVPPVASTPPPVSAPEPASSPAAVPTENVTPPVPVIQPVPVAIEPVAVAPTPPEPVVPASVVPQPNTTVVVPPAPANPTPPAVTVTALPPQPSAAEAPTASIAGTAASQAPPLSSEPAPAAPSGASPSSSPTPEPTPTAPAEPTMSAPPQPTPVPAPTPPEPVAVAPVTATADPTPQSIQAEEAALQAQIEDFAKQPASPTIEAMPAAAAPDNSSNDQTLASAVEQLSNLSQQTPPSPTTPPPSAIANPGTASTNDTPASSSAPIAHKKVISPITSNVAAGPNLQELLAKEEANQATPPVSPTVINPPGQPAAVQPPATPGQTFDPNSISL